MTQPHYNGWELPREVWAKMSPAFPGRLDLEYWRLDIMKRLYRFGKKDPPLLELQKILDILDYMLEELGGFEPVSYEVLTVDNFCRVIQESLFMLGVFSDAKLTLCSIRSQLKVIYSVFEKDAELDGSEYEEKKPD